MRQLIPSIGRLRSGNTRLGKQMDRQLAQRQERRRAARERLADRTDEATGLFDQRAWATFVEDELAMAHLFELTHHVFSIAVEFPREFDEREAISRASEAIKDSVRDTDFVARVNGDRFAVLLMDSPAETAMRIKARMHRQLGAARVGAAIGVEPTEGRRDTALIWEAASLKMLAEKRTQRPA